MPTFAYRARNRTGEPVTGTLVAETQPAALRLLDEKALLPIEVSEVAQQGRSLLTGRAARVSTSRIGALYEQLADLLNAGVPMLRALKVLSEQAGSAQLQRVLREVHDDIAGGDTFAEALEKHPHAFRPLHVSMIQAGEKGGFLEDVLTRLSKFVAQQDALRNKFIGAMIYPTVLLVVMLAAVTTLMVYVVPKIRTLLERQDLPWATTVVFGISDGLQNYMLQIGGLLLLAALGVSVFLQSEPGRRAAAWLQLKMAGIGKVYTMISLCRFCRVFGTLLANGIPVLHALRIAKSSTGNVILEEMIDAAAENVSAGEPLSQPLAHRKLFPPAMIDMIAVAEESNTLEKVLIQMADTQEERTGRQIELFVRLLEPAMLLVMGVVVGFIAVALLLPILQMATSGMQ